MTTTKTHSKVREGSVLPHPCNNCEDTGFVTIEMGVHKFQKACPVCNSRWKPERKETMLNDTKIMPSAVGYHNRYGTPLTTGSESDNVWHVQLEIDELKGKELFNLSVLDHFKDETDSTVLQTRVPLAQLFAGIVAALDRDFPGLCNVPNSGGSASHNLIAPCGCYTWSNPVVELAALPKLATQIKLGTSFRIKQYHKAKNCKSRTNPVPPSKKE